MIKRNDEELMLDRFTEYLRNNKGLQEKSVKDDISRINMMKKRNIDYTKGEDYARELLTKSSLSDSSSRSCSRVCRYFKEFLDQIRIN